MLLLALTRVLVVKGLNCLSRRRSVDKAEPERWLDRDPNRGQARGIDEVEAIDRLDKGSRGVKNLNATAAASCARKFLGDKKQLVYRIEHDRLTTGKGVVRTRKMHTESALRCEVVELHRWDK